MKKLFNFLLATAFMAVGFMGCSEETPVPTPDPGPDQVAAEEVPTYATFTFKLNDATTKAMQNDEFEPAAPINAFKSIRLLVFQDGANGICIADSIITTGSVGTGQSATVLVTSGYKKILVIANTGSKSIDSKLEKTQLLNKTYQEFLDINNRIDIGTGTLPAPVTGINFGELVQTATAETATNAMVYSNNLVECVKLLQPDIDEATSASGGSTEDILKNHFVITVERTVAKGIAFYAGKGTPTSPAFVTGGGKDSIPTVDNKGRLIDFSYNFRNLNRMVNLFQDQIAGVPKPPIYYQFGPGGTPPDDENDLSVFLPYYYKDDNIATPLGLSTTPNNNPAGLPTGARNLYIPENNTDPLKYGAITYAGIKATYIPKTRIVSTVADFNTSLGAFTGVTLGNINVPTTFYYLRQGYGTATELTLSGAGSDQAVSIPEETIFTDEAAVKKVVYVIIKGNLTGFADSVADAGNRFSDITRLKEYVLKYTNGLTYYRLNIHENVSTNDTKFFIRRNHWYQAAITSFLKIGASEIGDLDDGPGGGPDRPTYVTAVITVKPWTVIYREDPVGPWAP